jgi:Ca2+-transporting ATPase
MAYTSTLVTYGQATAIVTETGDRTEVGRISQLISSAHDLATPLTRKITQFSQILLYAILLLALLTVVVGLLRGQPLFDMFMAAVALAVMAIPEGLPAAVTITLAIGVSRMAKRRAIIRKLPAVETLGSTTVICSDKTGTLTKNQMTVRLIVAGEQRYEVSGSGYAPDGTVKDQDGEEVSTGTKNIALNQCLQAGVLCNDSLLKESDQGWEVQGDPTEGALITAAAKFGISKDAVEQDFPRLDSIPFESQHQYMATLHHSKVGKAHTVYMKGAVEQVLAKCTFVMGSDGSRQPLTAAPILLQVTDMADRGLRVLALACKELPVDTGAIAHQDVDSGLTFLGLQAMLDPPRKEAMAAVKICRAAGITIKMITGDHPATAAAIAEKIGIVPARTDTEMTTVLTGRELEQLSDKELILVADKTAVFARATPEQKIRLVKALQAKGNVVAMTGDGVNDAPALKQADIGVAMGITGTDVSREAADMVLTDDYFSSIEAAVEEGRGVFDNLTKFIV